MNKSEAQKYWKNTDSKQQTNEKSLYFLKQANSCILVLKKTHTFIVKGKCAQMIEKEIPLEWNKREKYYVTK